ncbi:D-2-hydroxyacid dehydrogenase [Streptomyces sp. NPDC058770]|uniref:D-2-hydroxyacid dehydrogenase n=1 Tax=Streptomyces sp. NPDC058770 TaxID=3346631 RepID=UPI0036CFE84F
MNERLRTVLATPLDEELCRLVEQLEPRVELIRDHSLLPPMRYPADHAGDPSFRRTPTQQSLFEKLLDSADALYGIPGEEAEALHRTVIANPRLRWVQTMAAGGGAMVRAAGLPAHCLNQVVFTTSAGVHGAPLAEFAVFGLLLGAKGLPRLQHDQRRHEWADRWFMGQLRSQSILILGLGGIGAQVARRLSAFGCHVIGTSRRPIEPPQGVDEVVHPDDLPSIIARVHGLVVALPGTDATQGMIGAELLARVRPGLTIVNVGRGTVIDEAALTAALRDGRVGYAALDVTAVEPLPNNSPLWDLPNVLISPHTATADTREDRAIAELFAANATRLLDGLPMRNQVDTVEFY